MMKKRSWSERLVHHRLAALLVAPASCTLLAWGAHAQSFPELDAARAAARAAPGDADAQIRLGDALLEARDTAAAREAYEAALGAAPNSVRAVWGIARTRMADGDYEESRTACRKVIQAAGANAPEGHVCMGQAYLVWRRSSLAIEEFEKALEADPANAEASSGIGDAHARANAIDEAIAAYRQAVAADGNLVAARLGLAQMLGRRGDKAGAIEQLRAAIAARSWSADAHYQLGMLLDDAAEGLDHLRQAVSIRPRFTEAQIEYGTRLSALGRWAEAVAPLRVAVEQQPAVGQHKEHLGIALWRTNQLQEAQEMLRAAIRGVPNSPRANEALGEVLVALGRTDDGIASLEMASNLDSSNPSIPYRLAQIVLTQDRPTMATGYLDRALAIRGNFSRAHTLYGDILYGQGRYAEALASYRAAAAGDGEGVDIARIRARVQELEAVVPADR